ncbi:hypothetical protein CHS0354_032927 [Potamilus streckersoni]|uniref:Bifunctional lysine-specific demethylase and histidyl-hydroxylase n=1 Tax=Potamilus streckersoni TaxID=2493646 RepID=A0AAE0RWD0_9BIVA|nr:hypothetical protein CHS0354_032927 [Potamilus streckersoni]
MKKVSAFSVFKMKKEKEDSTSTEAPEPLRKVTSTPVIPKEEKKNKKNILKGGSFRGSLRGTKKIRPTILTDGFGNSPYVAGDAGTVKLTAVKPSPDHHKEMQSLKTSMEKMVNGTEKNNSVHEKGKSAKEKKNPKLISPKSKKSSDSSVSSINLPPKPVRAVDEESSTAPAKKRRKIEKSPSVQSLSNRSLTSERETSKTSKNSTLYMYDSSKEAEKVFECLIHPVKMEKFFKELWEKKPLLVKRHMSQYNSGWFSTAELQKILQEENVKFGINLDITSYVNGKRETHNPPGRAYAPVVWDFYQNGCSVRLLNPQTYSKNVWKLLSRLQEFFGCCIGANVYLTPAGSQGFAPHYDDIEAFILQLEGKKHWKLYGPRNVQETLPRFSSGNFDQGEIGEPILDVVLEAGDLLYFPRGTIHQAKTMEDAHSLHITVSCYQKNTWGDFLQQLVPKALHIAVEEDIEFREGMPLDYLNYMGLAFMDIENPRRKDFLQKVTSLVEKMMTKYAPVDAACDQMGKQFVHDSLPPVLSDFEKANSIHGTGEHWEDSKKQVVGTVEIEPDTHIKIIRKGILRLVTEDENVRIYHSLDNTRIYHGIDPQFIEITAEAAPAVEYLILAYPDYVPVDSLPLATIEDRIEIASTLYDYGLIVTEEPLEPIADDDDASNNKGKDNS